MVGFLPVVEGSLSLEIKDCFRLVFDYTSYSKIKTVTIIKIKKTSGFTAFFFSISNWFSFTESGFVRFGLVQLNRIKTSGQNLTLVHLFCTVGKNLSHAKGQTDDGDFPYDLSF